MQIDFLGHASMIVKGESGAALFDPLLFGVHHEGLYDIYPARELAREALPPFDAVFVSHGHLDHFDVASLATIPRDMRVITAADRMILSCLQGLGFERIEVMKDMKPIQVGSLTVLPTPGAPGSNEHGFLVIEGETAMWNLVDTQPSAAAIADIKARAEGITAAVVPWQPILDEAIHLGAAPGFPYDMYAALVANVLQIDAGALVTGACGFQAVGPAAWTNHLMFPVTRRRFVEDVEQANPALRSRVFQADAGDRLVCVDRLVDFQRGALDYCRSAPYDWEELSFRPLDVSSQLVEHRGPLFEASACLPIVEGLFEGALPRLIEANRSQFDWHFRWAVRQEIEVVFSDGRRSYTLDFSGPSVRVTPGRSPLSTGSTLMTAGMVVGLCTGTISWEYAVMSGEYRHRHHTYLVEGTGLKAPAPARIPDVMRLLFGDAESKERFLASQIETLMTRPE